MISVRLADFNICIDNKYPYLENACRNYIAQGTPELFVSVSDEEIEREGVGDKGYLESLAVYRRIAEWCPTHGAFLMHCSVVDVDGVGVAFLAPSGVGKTTHTANWKRLVGNRLTVVNGDKPLIRRTDEGFFAYGTPWSGKEGLNTNTKTPLRKICFIERAEKNRCVSLDDDLLQRLIRQTFKPIDTTALLGTVELLDELIKNAEFYLIKCNKDPISAEIAYKTVIK